MLNETQSVDQTNKKFANVTKFVNMFMGANNKSTMSNQEEEEEKFTITNKPTQEMFENDD